MQILRQSTVVTLSLGPFVDPTDNVTVKSGLVANLDGASGVKLSKNGGTLAVRNGAPTHASAYDAYGCYQVWLDATDTNTLGQLRVIFAANATAQPIWRDFLVVPANVYDSLTNASIFQKVDIAAINTVAADAALLAANVEGDVVGTVSTSVNGAGSATQLSFSDITEATAQQYIGKQATVISGACKGQCWGVAQTSVLTGGENVITFDPGSPTGEVPVASDKMVFKS